MLHEKRYQSGDSRKLIGRILREVFDAFLLIAILASIAFLVYYLQIPPEERPPLSDIIPWGTKTPGTVITATPTPTPLSAPSSAPIKTSTVTPSPTATSAPTPTSTPSRISSATPGSASAAPVTVEFEIEDGKERGDRIVQAIEAYTSAKGFYPASLDDLVPDYLSEPPFTVTDQPFIYRVFDRTTVMSPEIYWVSFRVAGQSNLTCTYYRRLQYWDCNFSSP